MRCDGLIGKTTTLSILTGLIEPTNGDCLIWNCRLSSELSAIRQLTGICPQHNVLFPTLTVKEHLLFFGRMKGIFGPDLRGSVDRCIEDVGLVEKRDVLSCALSGGMKRKLCLAMALIGDPKFVLLDEPTSGMDPYSRRSTWELLQKSKAGRVIILTTHFMVCSPSPLSPLLLLF
jgi:ATP-binding cassette, subfamily A (ABC1), member 3